MDHVAINVNDLEWNIKFFEDVFGMTVTKEGTADNGKRQVWLSGGIQLVPYDGQLEQGTMNHLGIAVDDVDAVLSKADKYNVVHLEKGWNWIVIPTGLLIEVLGA